MKKAVSLHQLNQTDVEKRYHHLLLIQNILGKLSKKRVLIVMRALFFCAFLIDMNLLKRCFISYWIGILPIRKNILS